jgi:hypothetical protein
MKVMRRVAAALFVVLGVLALFAGKVERPEASRTRRETRVTWFSALHSAGLIKETLDARTDPQTLKCTMGCEEENWPEAQDRMIDAMLRLERALRPHLRDL